MMRLLLVGVWTVSISACADDTPSIVVEDAPADLAQSAPGESLFGGRDAAWWQARVEQLEAEILAARGAESRRLELLLADTRRKAQILAVPGFAAAPPP